jgi:hypothetical protein
MDLVDDRVRMRGPNDGALQFAGNDDVGDESPAAAQKPRIFDAPDRCADADIAIDRGVYCSSSRRSSSRP